MECQKDGNGESIKDGQSLTLSEADALITDVNPDVPSILTLYAQYRDKTLPYYSHTANIDDAGVRSGRFAYALNTIDVITIPGATKIHVKYYCTTYAYDEEWGCVWAGKHPDYTLAGNYSTSKLGTNTGNGGKFGGGSKNAMSDATVIEGDIDGDSVTFGFKSDSSSAYYGYYAVETDASTSSVKALTIFGSWDD